MKKFMLLLVLAFGTAASGNVAIASSEDEREFRSNHRHHHNHPGLRRAIKRVRKRTKANAGRIADNISAIIENKGDIVDHDARISALEGVSSDREVAIDCTADSNALLNATLRPGNTYVLTGMCDGPVYINEPAGFYRFKGDATGVKDDGIISPPGRTEYYAIGFYGPIAARFDNLRISAENYTSQIDDVYTAAAYVEGNASVSFYNVDFVGGDAGVFSDNAYVYLGEGINVNDFGQTGLAAGRGGSILIGESITVTGATNLPGEYSEAMAAFRNGTIQVNNGGSFAGGTDDGSNANYESYSAGAFDNGTIRIRDLGTVNLNGIVGAFRSSTIRIQTGTVIGTVWSGDQSIVHFENMVHSGGPIEVFRGSGFRADTSILSNNSSDVINVGQMSNMRLTGSTVGNASGASEIELYGYGYLSLRNESDLGGRHVNCIDAQSFSPADAANIGDVSCYL